MSKNDILRVMDYLSHIVVAIDRIHRYVEDMTELTFLEDEKLRMRWFATLKSWVRRLTTLSNSTLRSRKPTSMCHGH